MVNDPYNLKQYDRPGGAQVSQALPQLLNIMGASGALGIQSPNPLSPKSFLPPQAQMGMNFAGQGMNKAKNSMPIANPFGSSIGKPPSLGGGGGGFGGGGGGQRPPTGGGGQPQPTRGGAYGGQMGSRFGTMGRMGGQGRQAPGQHMSSANENYSAYSNKLKQDGGIISSIRDLMSGLGGKGIDWSSLSR